jgi:hypothetical protein
MHEDKFETATFKGKRLIVITDSDSYGGTMDMLKPLTGGDPIPFEQKFKQRRSGADFTYQGGVVILSNDPIRTTDKTSGLERRRRTVEFNRVFTEAEKTDWSNKGGEAQLAAEMPGFVIPSPPGFASAAIPCQAVWFVSGGRSGSPRRKVRPLTAAQPKPSKSIRTPTPMPIPTT